MHPRILFFIGSLRSGGKERRLIELLTYLKARGYRDLLVVTTSGQIHYPAFHDLDIPHVVLKKHFRRKDPTVVFEFLKICKDFKPDLIHSWGRMQSLYSLPAVISRGIPLINSQITTAPPSIRSWSLNNIIDRINFRFSHTILSNSKAGLDSFQPPAEKGKVIYNGMNTERFVNLPSKEEVRKKYGIKTPYAVVMCASFTVNKDYERFIRLAQFVTSRRSDISFIGVGGTDADPAIYNRICSEAYGNDRILLPGRIDDVEALVNACDVGVLLSIHGEGISNSVLEYMALGKPVIANDSGGTRELVFTGKNGYLITKEPVNEIAAMLYKLLTSPDSCSIYGDYSKQLVEEQFGLEAMGKAFEKVYAGAILAVPVEPKQLETA